MGCERLRLSAKQARVMSWWQNEDLEAIICDGAVRSGKTFAMGLSFFLWASRRFQGRQLAFAGRPSALCGGTCWQTWCPICEAWGCRSGSGGGESVAGPLQRAGKPLFALWRAGRVQRGADPGEHPGRGAAGRGGANAPVLRGAGHRPVQRAGEPAVVQLQPGEPPALVLSGSGCSMPGSGRPCGCTLPWRTTRR